MSKIVSDELTLVLLAALAFLHWRDTGNFPSSMSKEIDGDKLVQAIDYLSEA